MTLKRAFMLLPLTLLTAVIGVVTANRAFPPDLSRLRDMSLAVQARDGAVLDVLTSRDGYWRLPAALPDVDPRFVTLLLATEDKRFWRHHGVDPLAMARAAWQLATRGHVVSGGSTITMQVARLLSPHPHDLAGKLFDMARALQLEARFSKPQILAMYLTLAPYGGNIEGIRAASLIYFQKQPARLTEAEAALLVALPRSPARLRPDRHPAAALRAARRVLLLAGLPADFPATDLPPLARHALPAVAPHLAQRLRGMGLAGMVRTTLDENVQGALLALARRERPWLGADADVAALVVDNRRRTVLGYLGGTDYLGPHGMVDMVRARRSPGSALKPFIYGMALDDGLIVPDTLIEDAPMDARGYAPRDFDQSFHGLVTVREALQQSYNLPAVALLRAVGPARLVAALRAAGAVLVLPGGAAPSLPVALGGLGISMQDLAMLYTGLADRGTAAPLALLDGGAAARPVPEMTALAAAEIGDMLRGAPLPDGVAADATRPVAYKTGTSYGFRDAWAAGYSGDYTVVVWVGRVDGTPRPGAYGRAAAAPLLYKIFNLLPADRDAPATAPAPAMADLSPSLKIFGLPAAARLTDGGGGPKILFPPDDATLQVSGEDAPVSLEAAGGTPPYRWLVNGSPLPAPPVGFSMSWQPTGPGFAHISVIDRNEQAASEDVQLR